MVTTTSSPLPPNCEYGNVSSSGGQEMCIFLHVTKHENINNRKCIIDAIFTKNDVMFAFAGEPNDEEQNVLIRLLSRTRPYRLALKASETLL